MSPENTGAQDIKNKMSVAQLEQFVSFIVKRSCGNGTNPDHVGVRPKWWPRDLAFSYPIERTSSMDLAKWRETLLDVIARCYTYKNKDNGYRYQQGKRITQTGKLRNQVKTATDQKNELLLPVVTLCDVLKTRSKNDFLNYFKLSDGNHSVITKSNHKPPSHPLHLLNTHQVPFSSDLGKKMTKDCHLVPQEVHERKIERTERYLNTQHIEPPKNIEYEITYNKNPTHIRTYSFPTKTYRHKKLSNKARFLLKFCKPCSVTLPKYNLKPNISPLKEHNQIQHPPKPTTPYNLNSVIQLLNKKENLVLNDLVPKESLYKHNKNDNILNASVLLTPLNNLFGINNNVTKSNKAGKKKFNKNIKKGIKFNNNRIQKRRVLIYHPRRFSLRVLRLKYVKDK